MLFFYQLNMADEDEELNGREKLKELSIIETFEKP